MLGVFQLAARPHQRVHVCGPLLQPNHLVLEGVHAIVVLLPLQLQRDQLLATLLEAADLGGPVRVDGGVLCVDALSIGWIRLA